MATKGNSNLSPAAQQAIAALQRKRQANVENGLPPDGGTLSVGLPLSDREIWAAWAHLTRLTGLDSGGKDVKGMEMWRLHGRLPNGTTRVASCIKGNGGATVTLTGVPVFKIEDFTDADYAVADNVIASLSA